MIQQKVIHEVRITKTDGVEQKVEVLICEVIDHRFPNITNSFELSIENALELNRLLDNKLGEIPY